MCVGGGVDLCGRGQENSKIYQGGLAPWDFEKLILTYFKISLICKIYLNTSVQF